MLLAHRVRCSERLAINAADQDALLHDTAALKVAAELQRVRVTAATQATIQPGRLTQLLRALRLRHILARDRAPPQHNNQQHVGQDRHYAKHNEQKVEHMKDEHVLAVVVLVVAVDVLDDLHHGILLQHLHDRLHEDAEQTDQLRILLRVVHDVEPRYF